MKREVDSRVTINVCDLCEKNRARPYWRCFGCGREVCEQCSATFCGGIGECDCVLVCNRCSSDGDAGKVNEKVWDLRDKMISEQNEVRERCVHLAADWWREWKENRNDEVNLGGKNANGEQQTNDDGGEGCGPHRESRDYVT